MIPRIRELLHATPFVPCTIHTSEGREYIVPTADHAMVTPKGSRVVIFFDDERQADVAALHVATVVRNGDTGR
jgi:hypothetical protein